MPEPMFHMAMGSGVGYTASIAINRYINRSKRKDKILRLKDPLALNQLYLTFIIVFLCGLWAMVPNMLYFCGLASYQWTHSPIANIFFFKHWIEVYEHTVPLSQDTLLTDMGYGVMFTIYGSYLIYLLLKIKTALKAIQRYKREHPYCELNG